MKVVLDTNILLSIYLWGKDLRFILDAIKHSQITVITSDHLLEEFGDVLSRDKFSEKLARTQQTVSEIMTQIRGFSQIAYPTDIPTLCTDPDDNYVLACAEAGEASYIITGDNDLLRMGSYLSIPIIRPSTLQSILNPNED